MSRDLPTVTLARGRERSLLRRHPWVFSGAIDSVSGAPEPGATVEVRGADGRLLGRGAYSPRSQIAVRLWTFDDEAVDHALLRRRLRRALRRRAFLGAGPDEALRLVHGESDGLPGLIVDRYAGWVVCQLLAAGVERWREELVQLLAELLPDAAGIYERSDAEVRRKEGLEPRSGPLAGGEPPDLVPIREGPVRYLVDLRQGHKTGFYLDQRQNRARVAALARETGELLNAFAYSGGFAIAALHGGARRVVNVESSAPALALCARHLELNGLEAGRAEAVEGDVFQVLRRFRDAGRGFDAVVLDPPKFVESRAQLKRGSRGYKDINLLALKLLRPGGLLFTFSCSGLVQPELFHKIVADAALDAGREAVILERLGQAPDHPVSLAFPEGHYLKGLVCQVG